MRIAYTPTASADIAQILIYLDDIDPDIADRFQTRLESTLAETVQRVAREITEEGRPFDVLDDAASLVWSQPVYRLKVETAEKRVRRSNTGLW